MEFNASDTNPETENANKPRFSWTKIVVGVGFGLFVLFGYLIMRATGMTEVLVDGEQLRTAVEKLGLWGPVAIIGSMTVAILISPIPSAPIAVAAGAAYGHFWGTAYVVAGSVAGAVAAFGLARLVGHEILRRWFGHRVEAGWLGSQTLLMGAVFVSRLIPFISFDVVSYMAGLSVLTFWRFAVATLFGIVPASFLLAHFGSELAVGDLNAALFTALIVGAITLLPFLIKVIAKHRMTGRVRRKPEGPKSSSERSSSSAESG